MLTYPSDMQYVWRKGGEGEVGVVGLLGWGRQIENLSCGNQRQVLCT